MKDIKLIVGVFALSLVFILIASFFLEGDGKDKQENTYVDQALLMDGALHQTASQSAIVTIVEFADFECPACKNIHSTIKKVLAQYKGEVNFVYRHFPLPQHANAVLAAKTAEVAGIKGKFWEMYDLLYINQNNWSKVKDPTDIFMEYAKQIGIEEPEFKSLLSNKSLEDQITKDSQTARRLQVNSTPTFFIGNQKYTGNFDFQSLKNKIDETINQIAQNESENE